MKTVTLLTTGLANLASVQAASSLAGVLRALCGAPTLELHRAVKRYDADKLRALVVDGSPDLAEVDGEGALRLRRGVVGGGGDEEDAGGSEMGGDGS